MPARKCDAITCLALLSRGHWQGPVWRWDAAPPCCGFGQVGPARTQSLLAGRRLVFVGDSQTRRHMWAIVDAVGGARVRRRHGTVVADSHRAFDEAAIGLNDTIYDSQRAYHAGQTVLLNVRTGKWVLLDPTQLCGVDKTHWMTDHRLVGALERGKSEPWSIMRGAHYRLLLRVALRSNASATLAPSSRPSSRPATEERVRLAIQGLARDALHTWGCQKARVQECDYHEAIQRNCARRLSVVSADEARKRRGASSPSSAAKAASIMASGGAEGGEGAEVFRLAVLMGEVGGSCANAARELQRQLTTALVDVDAERHARTALTARQRRLRVVADGDDGGRGRGRGRGGRGAGRGAAARAGDLAALGARRSLLQGRAGAVDVPPRGLKGGNKGFGPRGGAKSGAALAATLATLGRQGAVVVAPYCASYCRRSHQLECPPTEPFEPALGKAIDAYASELGVGGRADPSLAVLTFLYAANLEGDMTSTVAKWSPRSYGHGADVVLVGATWASTMRTTTTARGSAAAGAHVALAWDAKLEAAWKEMLGSCSKAARCALRTVPEHLRQASPAPYTEFTEHVAPLAAAADVGLIDAFPGTWAGTRAGLMAHHDSTRIHFSDTGRSFLAQLTLNALPWLLAQPSGEQLPPVEREGELSV